MIDAGDARRRTYLQGLKAGDEVRFKCRDKPARMGSFVKLAGELVVYSMTDSVHQDWIIVPEPPRAEPGVTYRHTLKTCTMPEPRCMSIGLANGNVFNTRERIEEPFNPDEWERT